MSVCLVNDWLRGVKMDNSCNIYKNNNYKNIKRYRIMIGFILIFIIMWILFAFSTGNADYSVYRMNYESISNDFHDVGYNLLVLVFNYLGFSYQAFLAFFSLLGLLLIANTILKFSAQPTKVLLLYCIFPFFFDIVQIRNFIAMAIVLYAIRYLLVFSRKNFIKYCACILIAYSFHTVALFYFVFLFAYMKNTKTIFKLSTMLAVCGSVLMLGSVQLIESSVFGNILKTINPKALYYMGDNLQSNTRLLFIVYIISICIVACIVNKFYFKSLNKRSDGISNITEINNNNVRLLSKLCTLSSIFVIFVILDPTLFRVFRNVLIYFYMISTYVTSDKSKRMNIIVIFINSCIVGFSVLSFVNFLIKDATMYDFVTFPILNNNLLFEALNDSWMLYTFLLIFIIVYLLINYYIHRMRFNKG